MKVTQLERTDVYPTIYLDIRMAGLRNTLFFPRLINRSPAAKFRSYFIIIVEKFSATRPRCVAVCSMSYCMATVRKHTHIALALTQIVHSTYNKNVQANHEINVILGKHYGKINIEKPPKDIK